MIVAMFVTAEDVDDAPAADVAPVVDDESLLLLPQAATAPHTAITAR